MAQLNEKQAFTQRLRAALKANGVRISPTVVANEFNLRYWGRSITPHTARNWLLGNALPTQDKLRVLAEWLQVEPQELRFGTTVQSPLLAQDSGVQSLNMVDREMLGRY
jgi:transcriptional regulator with XRE-family HTH domain